VLASFVVAALASCGDDQPTGPGDYPDVRGSWSGQYSVTDCEALTGIDPFFCTDVFFDGRSLVLDVVLDQSNERVTGNATQGSIAGQVSGTVDMSGLITLGGTIGVDAIATTTIEAWETELNGDRLEGFWEFLVEDNQDLGFGSALVTATMTLLAPNVPNILGCPTESSVALTDSINGLLAAGDCMLSDTTYYDLFEMDVQVGDSVEFRMVSQDFNPFLIVTDIDGEPLNAGGALGDSVASVGMLASVDEKWLIVTNTLLVYQYGDYRLITTEVNGAAASSSVVLRRAPLENRLNLGGVRWPDPSDKQSARELLDATFASPAGAAAIKKLKGIDR